MAMDLFDLHKAIDAAVPGAIVGVSVGNWTDKNTWVMFWADSATQAQKDAVAAFILTVDPTQPTPDQSRLAAFIADIDRQNIVGAVQTATPAQIKTYITNNVTDLATARTMLIKIALLVAKTIRD